MKDKLKAIVERAIENGWNDSKRNDKIVAANDVLTDSITGITTITIMIVTVYAYGEVESYYKYTVSDILFNHKFMKPLLGNGCTNFKDVICTEDRVCTFSESCETCEYYAPINAMLEAAKLPTDQQRIDYVHGLIKGEV